MKQLAIPLSLVFSSMLLQGFEFIDQKVNGVLSTKFLQEITETFKPSVFFETGTYSGKTTLAAVPFFEEIYTVELFTPLYNSCKKKFEFESKIHFFNESSPETIARIAPTLRGPVVFWLDAHYSGEGTALSNTNQNDPASVTAIRAELEAINKSNIQDCVILIDDIRGFGTKILNIEYLGCWA